MLDFIVTMFSSPIQILGSIGTMLCFFAYCMKNEFSLRVVSIISSVIFIPYNLAIDANSLLLLNLFCMIVNIYKIIKMKKSKPIEETAC